jgi:hypothetical protein
MKRVQLDKCTFTQLKWNISSEAEHSGLRHEIFRPLKQWDRGFESNLMRECLAEFLLCLYRSVCRWRPIDYLNPRPKIPTDTYFQIIPDKNRSQGLIWKRSRRRRRRRIFPQWLEREDIETSASIICSSQITTLLVFSFGSDFGGHAVA